MHRDVKPENVLLTADGRVKVVDFGLARAQAAAGNTRAGLIIGTVAYIAPEQVTGGVTDVRTDVYAAGVMLFEMLTGRQPHTGESPLSVAYKHVNSEVPPPGNFVAGVPPAVDQLVWAATSRDPQRRPADAGEFLRAVRVLRGGEHRPRGDRLRCDRGVRRHAGSGVGGAVAAGPGPAARRRRAGAGFGGAPAAGGSHTMVVPGGAGYDRSGHDRGGYDRGGYATGRFDAGGAGYGGEDTYHGHEPFLQRWLFSRRLAYVAAAVAAVIGLGVGGWYVTSGRYTPLPSVDGMTLTAAEQALHQAGFGVRVGTPLIDNNVPKGDVVSTSPSGRAVKGATIVLTVSSGPKMIVIPPVTGKTLGDAISALRAAGLTVSDTPNKVGVDGAAVGSVAGTTPAAGTSWPANRSST